MKEKAEKVTEKLSDGERFFRDLQKDPHMQKFLMGVIAGVLTLVLIFLWTRRRSRGRTLLLLGPCEAGKTSLFAQLIHKKAVETYTSTTTNEGLYSPPGRGTVTLVDVPGHERLRTKFVDRYKSGVRGIIYVVDSATIQKQLRDATEFLFNVLSDPVLHSNRPKVMVVCNKQDIGLSKGSNLIRRELEKEIHLLRETHSRTLQGTDNSSADTVYLGRHGQDFAFDDLQNQIDFCEVSAINEQGMDDLQNWIKIVA